MRAINPNISPLRRLAGGCGAGINTGGYCVGAEEPLPGLPLEVGARADCPLDVAVEYSCEGGKGVLIAPAYAGLEAPVLPPVVTGGVLCPPLDEEAKDEPDWAINGNAVEACAIGSTGEDSVAPGDRLGELGAI